MSYSFNGSSQWIGNATTSPVTAMPITIGCWFKPTVLNNMLISMSNATGSDALRMAIQTSGAVQINVSAAGTGITSPPATTTFAIADNWHHICGVFASTTSRTVYLDGGGSATNTQSLSPAAFTRLQLGARRLSSTVDAYFNGFIAEVGIWNISLSAAEIISLADGISCQLIRPQNLVFYSPLLRNLVDISKTNLALTNTGTATVSDHPRVYL